MGVIRGKEIDELVRFLEQKGISLFHACQLQDYESYLKLDGIPSRELLEKSNLAYTPFSSDTTDKRNNYWDKVFFNLNDFGRSFHQFQNACTPNVYGPIVIEFNGFILEDALDISITLCSITDPGFSRERDSLSLDDAKLLFKGKYLRNRTELKALFPNRKIMNPEVNVTFGSGKSQLLGYKSIMVDPLELGTSLTKIVRTITSKYDENAGYYVRQRTSNNQDLYQQLIHHSSLNHFTEASLQGLNQPWLERVLSLPPMRGFILNNFLQYLQSGTIQRMKEIEEDISLGVSSL